MINRTPNLMRGLILALIPLLASCQELEALRDRTAVQEAELARLRKENQEFQNTYYQINEERTAETKALNEQVADLQRQLQRARQNLTEREQKLEEDLKLCEELNAKARRDLEGRLAETSKTAESLNQNLSQTSERAAQLESERAALAEQRARLEQERDTLRGLSEQKEKDLKAAKEAQAALGAKQKEVEQALEKERTAREAAETAAKERKPVDHRKDEALAKAADTLKERIAKTEAAEGVEVELAARGLRVILPVDQAFDKGTVIVAESFKPVLAVLAEGLKSELAGRLIRIEGHTDNQPTVDMPFADNWSLGAARADKIRQELAGGNGVDESLIEVVSRGAKEPRAGNDTPEGMARNRRVELVITGPRPK